MKNEQQVFWMKEKVFLRFASKNQVNQKVANHGLHKVLLQKLPNATLKNNEGSLEK